MASNDLKIIDFIALPLETGDIVNIVVGYFSKLQVASLKQLLSKSCMKIRTKCDRIHQ
jgi:hypothetical protein